MAQHPQNGFVGQGLPIDQPATSMSPQSVTHSTIGGSGGGPNRNMIACLSCRRQKIKCHPSPTSPPDPCARCARMELSCDFLKHNRGRKKKVRVEGMEEGMEESKEKVLEEKERHDRIVAEEERYAGMSSGDENMSDRKNGSPFERKQGFDRFDPSVPPSIPQFGSSSFTRVTPIPIAHQLAALMEGQNQQSRSWSNKDLGSENGHYAQASNLSMTAAAGTEQPSNESLLRHALPPSLNRPLPLTTEFALPSQSPLTAGSSDDPTTTNPPTAPIFSLRSMLEPWQDSDASSSASDDNITERDDLGPDVDVNIERQVPTGLPTAGILKMAQERARAGRRELDAVPRGGNVRIEDTEGERPRKRRREEGGTGNDPVSVGFLSEEKARDLFRLFMVFHNPSIGLLDPQTDSFESVRANSSCLFTAILSTSTRPYRADLSTSLSSHQLHLQTLSLARQHATMALAGCERSVDVVKALVVMSMWKEVEDERAAGFLNRAILVAKEMQFDRPQIFTTLSPFAKRESHANKRLWFKLFIINSLTSILHDQPILIDCYNPLLSTVDEWHHSSSHPDDDISIIANVRLFKIYHALSEALPVYSAASEKGGRQMSEIFSRRVAHDLEEATGFWLKRMEEFPHPKAIQELKLNASLIYLQLSILQLRSISALTSNTNLTTTGTSGVEEELFHRALTASLEMLREFAGKESEALAHAPDHVLSIIPLPVSFLVSLSAHPFFTLSPSDMDAIRSLTREVINRLMDASLRGNDWCASMGRFVRGLSGGLAVHGDRGMDEGSQASGIGGYGIRLMEWKEVYEGWRQHVRSERGWSGDVELAGSGTTGE